MIKRRSPMHSWLQKPPTDKAENPSHLSDQNQATSISYGRFLGVKGSGVRDHLTNSTTRTGQSECFNPNHYFTPGWQADSLFSKPATHIKKLQEELWSDAKSKVRHSYSFNQKLKLHIHREFTNSRVFDYKETAALGDFNVFWKEFVKPSKRYRDTIDSFVDLYSFRIATVYVFKLRFLISLARELNIKFTSHQVINPSSFLMKFFKKGSSSEISCEALHSNQYSWYRPSAELAVTLEKKSSGFDHLSISQLMRLFSSPQHHRPSDDTNFSHALSHKDFGIFINQLLIFFPLWMRNDHFKYPQQPKTSDLVDVINTKFTGDSLESMVHSHWLAQEHNLHIKWSELLCADFSSPHSSETTYIQVCQELHFMTFLVKFAREQNYPTKETIVRIMRDKYSKSQASQSEQHSLFADQRMAFDLAYDRIVLNLTKLPKKNPHHYLVTQIQAQEKSLSEDANILVLTNQKLFVPSQSQKVKTLLEKFRVKGVFDLEKLAGKGEIPQYVYIFKRRTPNDVLCYPPVNNTLQHPSQEPCLTFKISGILEHFSMFELISKEFFSFFNTKSIATTGIYHRNINDFLTLQYHQDSIIQGKLLSSQNDHDHITHPNFFKNLTKNCSPLEHFFQLDDLSHFKKKRQHTQNLLGQSPEEDTPYQNVFIVNIKDSGQAHVEIASWSTYHAKREEYGNAYYHYYGATAKKRGINTNLLREYLISTLGRQVVQLCLNGHQTKIKGRLQSLLIPSFLANEVDNYHQFFHRLELMMKDKDAILKMSPEHYLSALESDRMGLNSIKGSPWLYMSCLVHFRHILQSIINDSENDQQAEHLYSNPYIIGPISRLETQSLHPSDEVFLDFNLDHKEQLELPFTRSLLEHGQEGRDGTSSLKLYSHSKLLVTLHSDPHLLQFVHFILSRAEGLGIGDLIKNITIPRSHELKNVIDQHKKLVEMYRDSLEETTREIQSTFKTQITSS